MTTKMNAWELYKKYLRFIQWKIHPRLWIAISLLFSLAMGGAMYLWITMTSMDISPLLAGIVFIVFADLLIGLPYFKASRKIDAIEEYLSDALKQMADTLKAGGTYEYALREVANSEYGPLSEEMELALRRLEEGENLETSLRGFADNIESRLVKRSINIILDSIKAGAGLADVLDEIADDIRDMYRLKQERKSFTMMQVLFMVAAGTFVAPFIFGMVSTLISFFIEAASTGLDLSGEVVGSALRSRDIIVTMMQFYIFIEVVATSAMIAIMREGKVTKSIIYIPVLLLIAYLIYYGSRFMTLGMIGG